MKCKSHKYVYQLKGNGHLLNPYTDFACMRCGLNWRYDPKCWDRYFMEISRESMRVAPKQRR